ncbi:MAG: bifunctional folylpolyglutamate synthase/dihydrofolate synthase [Candidatus Hydrogenedentes bacterium]|nr:bifunctional folylpolyglutamate synthase/dihydrofolate synthase [Candidatus Hydrogenedentota bacterium]
MTDATLLTPALSPREYLYSLTLHGVKLGLENIRALLDAAGMPQYRYPTVHIAGTNGKGSVAALVQAMFRAAGYRAGCFTSPHLIDLTERFQINGQPIAARDLDAAIAHFGTKAKTLPRAPTFFELNTAIAFHYFAEERVDVAVIEVGMGGRFDSTNVILPQACAITSIDLEHTEYLGDTHEKIAFEKAGIIKPGVPVIVGERKLAPQGAILERASALASPAYVLGRDFDFTLSGDTWQPRFSYRSHGLTFEAAPLSLVGPYQGDNAAVAVRLAEALREAFPALDARAILRGLADARWPCRLERVLETPPVVVDATHTVAGARFLHRVFERCHVIFAVSSDKDARHMLEAMRPIVRTLTLTVFDGKRAMRLEQLAAAADDIPYETAPTLHEAIARALPRAEPSCPLLVTGSVFAAGEARRILIEHYAAAPLAF